MSEPIYRYKPTGEIMCEYEVLDWFSEYAGNLTFTEWLENNFEEAYLKYDSGLDEYYYE